MQKNKNKKQCEDTMNCIPLTSNAWLELNNVIICSKFKKGKVNSKKKKQQQLEFQSEDNVD